MTILVDLDDTLEQLLAALVKRANERFGRHATVDDVTDWSIVCAFPGISKREILDFMREPDFWEEVRPIPGAAEALRHFMDEGHSVYVVTATECEHVRAKMEGVLFRYFPFLSWDQVIITSRKQMIRGDVLIDDGIHNLEGGSYRKILFTAPYNQDYDAEGNGMIRVHDWREIVGIIDRMESNAGHRNGQGIPSARKRASLKSRSERTGRMKMLETERLVLRRWEDSDAESLYEYASDPDVGPIAGWPAHQSPAESLQVIRTVLSKPETYAVCLKTDGKAIGSIGLKLDEDTDLTEQEDECELGYWIGKPFWGRGLIPEAAGEMLRHAFEDLGMAKVFCGYYDGNNKSKRVQEKIGLRYQWTTEEVDVPLMHETRKGHVTAITRQQWLGDRERGESAGNKTGTENADV